MKIRKHSNTEIELCECTYVKLDDSLVRRTNSKLPYYKCKRCDNMWINPEVKQNGN